MHRAENTISLADRLYSATGSVVATYCTAIVILFISKGALVSQSWISWLIHSLAVMAGVTGFVLGSGRMADIWGFVWRTNKPKDGHWC